LRHNDKRARPEEYSMKMMKLYLALLVFALQFNVVGVVLDKSLPSSKSKKALEVSIVPKNGIVVRSISSQVKIYVLGSTSFTEEMVDSKNKLCSLGFDGWIHPHYEAYVRGEMKDHLYRRNNGEEAALKRENDYFCEHYKRILESDAILFVNSEKNGIKNYIGGNVLIEMGQAYVNHKIIFLLNGMPSGLPYMDEIEAMDPICLFGDLSNIGKVLEVQLS